MKYIFNEYLNWNFSWNQTIKNDSLYMYDIKNNSSPFILKKSEFRRSENEKAVLQCI